MNIEAIFFIKEPLCDRMKKDSKIDEDMKLTAKPQGRLHSL